MMPLDVQARGPAEQLLLDRSMVGEDEPSGDARTVSPGSGTPRRSSAPPRDRLPREREDQGREQDHQHSGDRRRGVLRHPVAFAIGLIALLAATPAAYFYRISLLGLCRSFRSDRRRLYCGAPVRDCSRSIGPSHRRHRLRGVVDQIERAKNRTKSKVRAKVEHSIGVVKRVFGFAKSLPLARTGVRYRGLHKNADRLIVTCALANLFMARRHLLRCQQV
jgi:hypothetical protein